MFLNEGLGVQGMIGGQQEGQARAGGQESIPGLLKSLKMPSSLWRSVVYKMLCRSELAG